MRKGVLYDREWLPRSIMKDGVWIRSSPECLRGTEWVRRFPRDQNEDRRALEPPRGKRVKVRCPRKHELRQRTSGPIDWVLSAPSPTFCDHPVHKE
eukprot:2397808-Alexandrium_andersonii.AAC.1